MQHFRVKVFAKTSEGFSFGSAIAVFHRWIQTKALPGLLVDVADYQHVPAGPGVILVGHEAIWGLDHTKNQVGLLYTRRTVAGGSVQDRIRDAMGSALAASSRLEQEPEFTGKIRFNPGRLEISVNDRLLAPNNEETAASLVPEIAAVLDSEWGAGSHQIQATGAPRELFTVAATRRV
jgi:hypothetical protein